MWTILTRIQLIFSLVTQEQITNNAHTFKIFSVLLFCDVFSCKLLTQVIKWFLLQFDVFIKGIKCTSPESFHFFLVFEKFTWAYHHQIALKIML